MATTFNPTIRQTTYVPPKADADAQNLWQQAKTKLLATIGPRDVRYRMFENIQLQEMNSSKMVLSVSQPHLKRWAEAEEQMRVIHRFCDEMNPGLITIRIVLRTSTRSAPVFDPEEALRNRTPVDPPARRQANKGVRSRVTLPKPDTQATPVAVVAGETYHQRNARLVREKELHSMMPNMPVAAAKVAPEPAPEPVAKGKKPRKTPTSKQATAPTAVVNPAPDADGSIPLLPTNPKPRTPRGKKTGATGGAKAAIAAPVKADSPLGRLVACACDYLKIDYDEVMVGQPTVHTTRVKQMAAHIGRNLLGIDMGELSRLLGGIAEDKVQELLNKVAHDQQDDLKLDADLDQIGYLYLEQLEKLVDAKTKALPPAV